MAITGTVEYLIPSPIYLNSSLTLYQCGYENCKSGHAFGPAIRPHYLFHYVLSGTGEFHAKEKHFPLHEGQGFLICPGESTFYAADEQTPWNYCWFGFDGYEAKTILSHCGLSSENPIFTDQSGGGLKEKLMQLLEMFERSPHNEYEAMGKLYLVFSKMYCRQEAPTKTFDKSYSDKAVDFIHNSYTYDIKIGDIAKHVGIDRTYLYKIFMQVHNLSPQQYLIQFRLHVACHLLESTDMNITEVAYSCGFKDTPAFYKHFKRHYSVTPAEYRAKYGEKRR